MQNRKKTHIERKKRTCFILIMNDIFYVLNFKFIIYFLIIIPIHFVSMAMNRNDVVIMVFF